MNNNQETRHTTTEGNLGRRIALVISSIIEALLVFRFFFKLIGANASNVFVNGIYSFTQPLVGIFEGIFSTASTPGAETEAIFEPATLIAIIVVALIAWAIMKLMPTSSTSQVQRSQVSTGNTEVTSNVPNQYQNNQVRNADAHQVSPEVNPNIPNAQTNQVRNTDGNPVNQDVATNTPNQPQYNQVRNSDGTVVNQEFNPDGTVKYPNQNQ